MECLRTRTVLLFVAVLLPAAAHAQAAPNLRVYSAGDDAAEALFSSAPIDPALGGYALVREQRALELKAGLTTIDVPRIARWIDPGAVIVRTPPGVDLVGQSLDADPLGVDRLVERSLGATVSVESRSGALVSGTLLSNLGGLSLRLADGQVVSFSEYARITFPALPPGLSATPTLRWTLRAASAGTFPVDFAYPAHGIAWRGEYSAWLQGGADCRLNFGGWASVVNRSGIDFRAARVSLVAGEPNLIGRDGNARPALRDAKARGEPTESTLGDYREYAVDAPVDLPNGGQAQLALFAPQAVACTRQYLYEASRLRADSGAVPLTDRGYGANSGGDVASQLGFKLDRALPGGNLRVFEDRADAAPALLGEDRIGATPKGESVSLRLGRAFDLVGERTQTDFQFDKEARSLSETFHVSLRNRGGEARRVTVREHLYRWAQWDIAPSSAKYEKRSADTVDFVLEVPAGGEAHVDYSVRYRWSASFK